MCTCNILTFFIGILLSYYWYISFFPEEHHGLHFNWDDERNKMGDETHFMSIIEANVASGNLRF